MYVVILANTNAEAMQHAKKHGLPRGRFRYALRAASIRKLRVAEVHVLPGFARRLDRHAILAELRYAKVNWVTFDNEVDTRLADPKRAELIARRYEAIKAADSNALESEPEKPTKVPKAKAPKTPKPAPVPAAAGTSNSDFFF